MTAPTARPPLPVLTSLRFFAATDVVVYHEVVTMGHLNGANVFLRDLSSAGYDGMAFFFILSGFILTYVYSDNSEHSGIYTPLHEFWKARFARISPAYLLGLLLALPHFIFSALISKIITIPDFILGLALVPILQQAWWPRAAMAWNAPAWSLSVEFLFYLCFPALVFASSKVSRNYFALLAYAIVIAVAVLRYNISSPVNTFGSAAWNFNMFFPPFHLPEFLFGVALGRLYLFGPTLSRKLHGAMFWVGTIGIVLVFGARSLLPAWATTDVTLAPLFGLIIFGGSRVDSVPRLLSLPFLVLLGEVSYAMYILHMPLGWWWDWFTRRMHLPEFLNFAAYFAMVILISILSYLYVEKPMRRWILGHREHRPA